MFDGKRVLESIDTESIAGDRVSCRDVHFVNVYSNKQNARRYVSDTLPADDLINYATED